MENSNTILLSIFISLTGLIGAITGLVSIWITYLNYSRDNIRVRVRALKGMKTFIPGVPSSSSEKTFLVITAANAGHRPVTINKAAFVCLKTRGGGISSDSMKLGAQELKEGKAIDYMMEDDDIDYSDVSHIAVYDSVGNEYRYYLAPWYKRFFYWFLDISYIRRKPVQAPKPPKKKTR